MEISGTTQPASTGAVTPAQSSPTTDFETFLTLLTTQMRNQDPLNPMESTQFVEQLATFTSVEQQIETNTKLDNLTAALTANDTTSWRIKHIPAEHGAALWQRVGTCRTACMILNCEARWPTVTDCWHNPSSTRGLKRRG